MKSNTAKIIDFELIQNNNKRAIPVFVEIVYQGKNLTAKGRFFPAMNGLKPKFVMSYVSYKGEKMKNLAPIQLQEIRINCLKQLIGY